MSRIDKAGRGAGDHSSGWDALSDQALDRAMEGGARSCVWACATINQIPPQSDRAAVRRT